VRSPARQCLVCATKVCALTSNRVGGLVRVLEVPSSTQCPQQRRRATALRRAGLLPYAQGGAQHPCDDDHDREVSHGIETRPTSATSFMSAQPRSSGDRMVEQQGHQALTPFTSIHRAKQSLPCPPPRRAKRPPAGRGPNFAILAPPDDDGGGFPVMVTRCGHTGFPRSYIQNPTTCATPRRPSSRLSTPAERRGDAIAKTLVREMHLLAGPTEPCNRKPLLCSLRI
jgi:hypothetical protein